MLGYDNLIVTRTFTGRRVLFCSVLPVLEHIHEHVWTNNDNTFCPT